MLRYNKVCESLNKEGLLKVVISEMCGDILLNIFVIKFINLIKFINIFIVMIFKYYYIILFGFFLKIIELFLSSFI